MAISPPPPSSLRDEIAEVVSARLEIAELVEARAGGREQDDVVRAGRRAGRGEGVVEGREALARQAGGVLAEGVRDGAGGLDRRAQRDEVLALAPAPEQQVHAALGE